MQLPQIGGCIQVKSDERMCVFCFVFSPMYFSIVSEEYYWSRLLCRPTLKQKQNKVLLNISYNTSNGQQCCQISHFVNSLTKHLTMLMLVSTTKCQTSFHRLGYSSCSPNLQAFQIHYENVDSLQQTWETFSSKFHCSCCQVQDQNHLSQFAPGLSLH